jgi:hypothetical protein
MGQSGGDWMEIVLVELIARNVFLKFKCNEPFSLINTLSKLKENMVKHRKFG